MHETGRKEEVQEELVTLTVLCAAGQLSHPETLVWSHFYERARAHVLTPHSTWFTFSSTIFACWYVTNTFVMLGRLCLYKVCPCISVVIHNFIVGAMSHATKNAVQRNAADENRKLLILCIP